MSAYLIARINVTNWEQYKEYTKLTPALVETYGGKFVARGGDVVTLEGEAEERRVVVLEFPSIEQAEAFYHSPGYTHARHVREGAADAQFVIVGGM